MSFLLAGDVGGTKTVLCLYRVEEGGAEDAPLAEVYKATFPSGEHGRFRDLVREFLDSTQVETLTSACFGIAGPIHDQRCDATNLPWVIDAAELKQTFSVSAVHLLNDLEAAAYGMLHLSPQEFVELNPNAKPEDGHMAVIAAGTGLGEAILAWDGQQHFAMPTEGGHTDFGPNDAQETELLGFLRRRFGGHVSGERILAGDGFGNLYDFLNESGFAQPSATIEAEMTQADRNAVISHHGLIGEDPLCTEAVRLFTRIYGAEAGNLALKCLPRGGVYIGGGIGPKIRSALESGLFMEGFLDKGRMAHAIEHIPVRLALNAEAPLLGAAHKAVQLPVS